MQAVCVEQSYTVPYRSVFFKRTVLSDPIKCEGFDLNSPTYKISLRIFFHLIDVSARKQISVLPIMLNCLFKYAFSHFTTL